MSNPEIAPIPMNKDYHDLWVVLSKYSKLCSDPDTPLAQIAEHWTSTCQEFMENRGYSLEEFKGLTKWVREDREMMYTGQEGSMGESYE